MAGANVDIQITVKPKFSDLVRRFLRADKNLTENKRTTIRQLGTLMVLNLRDEAPRRTGKFAEKIHYKTFEQGAVVGFRTYSPQPLGGWIVRGTQPHLIRARNARSLVFYWANGPRGPGVYRFFSVNHPGTKPNPYPQRAYNRWKPQAATALRQLGKKYAADVKS